jgi:hypothetical protein
MIVAARVIGDVAIERQRASNAKQRTFIANSFKLGHGVSKRRGGEGSSGEDCELQPRNLPSSRSAARDRADDHEWLDAASDGGGEGLVGRLVRNVFVAGEESQECSPLLRAVVADRAAEHRVASFERVENRSLRRRPFDREFDFAFDAGERAQMQRQDDANHHLEISASAPTLR